MINLMIVAGDCSNDVKRSLRDVPPAHYTLEIDSFSDLQKMADYSAQKRYESRTFEVGGYKWKLCLYPNGDEERNGKGYISMYLIIAETDAFALGWEVHVKFKLFVYDHIQEKFLKVQDSQKRVWRFDRKKKECGFPRLISETDFGDTNNRYLKHDKCMFGVEIAMCCFGKGELVQPIKNVTSSYKWKLYSFSKFKGVLCNSEVFTMADYKWKLQLYPKGKPDGNGKYLSLFLCLEQNQSPPCLYVGYKLSILDQTNDEEKSVTGHRWFHSASVELCWGFPEFISLKELKDEYKGFLLGDSLHIEARITAISSLKIIS